MSFTPPHISVRKTAPNYNKHFNTPHTQPPAISLRIAYAHYDGQPEDLRWPYPDNNPAAAYTRLKRLGSRPHFVCSELDSTLNQTKPFIEAAGFFVNATYVPTGFCNHNSEWVLRDSPARNLLRAWYKGVVA